MKNVESEKSISISAYIKFCIKHIIPLSVVNLEVSLRKIQRDAASLVKKTSGNYLPSMSFNTSCFVFVVIISYYHHYYGVRYQSVCISKLSPHINTRIHQLEPISSFK